MMLKELFKKRESVMATPAETSMKPVIQDHTDLLYEFTEDAEKKMMILLKEEGALTHGFNELLGGTEYTLKEIRQVETLLQTLTNNSQNTQSFVEAVYESLEESHRIIGKTRDDHTEIATQMEAVTELFNQFYGLFNQLEIQYGEIQKFANMITHIANQTRLLSLNASIEAARVGAAGVGFSVVAEEIKKLSDESQKSAADIVGSLKLMTETIDQLSEKSSTGGSVVIRAKDMVQQSDKQIEAVVQAENRIRTGVEAVRDSQNANIENIEKISENLSNVLKKSDGDNRQLESLVSNIQKKSGYYSFILNHLNQISILKGLR